MQVVSRRAAGITFTLAGAILWGFSGATIQYLLSTQLISPLIITLVRMIGAGILFLIIGRFLQPGSIGALLASKRDIAACAVFGVAGLFFNQISYATTVGFTNSGTATVLASLSIIIVMLVSCAQFRKLPRVQDVVGLVFALLATFLIATKGDVHSLAIPREGLVMGFINAITVAIYVMYPRKLMNTYGSITAAGFGMLFGACAAVISTGSIHILEASGAACMPAITQLAHIPPLHADILIGLFIVTVIGTVGAFGMYLHGISIIGGVQGTLLGAAEPPSATIFPAVFLGTIFTWADWLGLIFMLITVVLVALPNKNQT